MPTVVYYKWSLSGTRLTLWLHKKGLPLSDSPRGKKLIHEIKDMTGVIGVLSLCRDSITIALADYLTEPEAKQFDFPNVVNQILEKIGSVLQPSGAEYEFELQS